MNNPIDRFALLVKKANEEEARSLKRGIRAWSYIAKEYPQRLVGHGRLGWCYTHLGDLDSAQASFETLLSLNPKHVGALRGLSGVMIAKGNPEAALAILNDIDTPDSEQDRFHVFRSKLACLKELGRKDDALTLIREQLDDDPEDRRLVQTGIDFARGLGFFDEAREIALKILTLDPARTSMRLNTAMGCLDGGDFALALEILEGTVPTDKRNPDILVAKGRGFLGLDRYEDAHNVLCEALEQNPQLEAACRLLCRIGVVIKQPERALEVLDRLGTGWKSDPELARIYLSTLADAGKILPECFMDPDILRMAETHAELGNMIVMYLLAPFREFETADHLSLKVFENLPGNLKAMQTRALFLNAAGRFDEADMIDMRALVREQFPKTLRDLANETEVKRNKDLEQSYQACLPIAWQLADQKRYSHEEWLKKAIDSTNRANLLFKVLQCDPQSKETAFDLIDEEQKAKVRKYFPEGQPAIIVGFHDNFPTPVALRPVIPTYHYTSHWHGGSDNGNLNGYERVIDGFEAGNMVKDLKAALQAGNVVGVAIDISMKASSPTSRVRERFDINLAGRNISFRTPLSYLVRQTGLPCYSVRTCFRDGKIILDIHEMPRPVKGEGMASWNARWQQGIKRELEKYLSSDPDLLNLISPIWRSLVNIKPASPQE
ncbi:tetratricopeptide repeat protein [Rhodovibrionaceae bacterium A322]